MKNTTIIFLRHADTQKDPSVNATKWGLSEKGKAQAEAVSTIPVMQTIDAVYVSSESKTTLTVAPLMQKLGKKAQVLDLFDEVKRGDKFLTKEEFEAEKIKQLEGLDYPAFGGESGNEALARFKKGIAEVKATNEGKTILIVTHGTILTIYFGDILNAYDSLPDRWSKTPFGGYGIVENGIVTKDIIEES